MVIFQLQLRLAIDGHTYCRQAVTNSGNMGLPMERIG